MNETNVSVLTQDCHSAISHNLIQAWESVLGEGSADDADASFFELGGDSLRVVNLWTRIESFHDGILDVDAFLAKPTLTTMRDLLMQRQGASRGYADDVGSADLRPLTSRVHQRLLSIVDHWNSQRVTPDRLMFGYNLTGTKNPIFFVCQEESEAVSFASQLGSDQPLYVFRSGHMVLDYSDQDVRDLSLHYIEDLKPFCTNGAVQIAGLCQGGIIALAMAQELSSRGRKVATLILIEWHFGLQMYSGDIVLIYGNDSPYGAIYKPFFNPEEFWCRNKKSCRLMTVPGSHGDLFDPHRVQETTSKIIEQFGHADR